MIQAQTTPYPLANIKFILFHRPSQTEINMSVLGICNEYSCMTFNASESEYGDLYKGYGDLPNAYGNDDADEYDVYVEINGVRHLYDGIFYSNRKEVRRSHPLGK